MNICHGVIIFLCWVATNIVTKYPFQPLFFFAEKNNRLFSTLIKKFVCHYTDQHFEKKTGAPACAYESFLRLFFQELPHDGHKITAMLTNAGSTEPRLLQHHICARIANLSVKHT